jgi:hypothetical protein
MLSLEVDGNPIQSLPASAGAGGSSSVTFTPFTVASRNMRGTVRLPDDALKRDNVFHFVVSPAEPVSRVRDRPQRRRQAVAVFVAALAIGESPRVELTSRTPTTFTDADARSAAVVILNDVQVSTTSAIACRDSSRTGGGVFIMLGPQRHLALPARRRRSGLPGDVVDRTTAPRGSAASSTATRCSSCSARRAVVIMRRRASTAIAPSRSRRDRCWRGLTTAARRCWSGRRAPAGC